MTNAGPPEGEGRTNRVGGIPNIDRNAAALRAGTALDAATDWSRVAKAVMTAAASALVNPEHIIEETARSVSTYRIPAGALCGGRVWLCHDSAVTQSTSQWPEFRVIWISSCVTAASTVSTHVIRSPSVT
ncbi:MAG: hypothetical protein OEX97_09500, partial [Acidimicrobiia bacterium]|nr:hypothetical protein [Acidimicrobiia bacterium]